MARLPQPGSDNGTWGDILNDYLSQIHQPNGTLKADVVTSAAIAPNAVTSAAIAPNSITNTEIASDAVNATSIADGSISESLLDANVQNKLNTAGSGNVADGTITTAKLQDGAVTDIKVSASAAIAQSKIANLTTDLAGKAATTHTHTASQISDSTTIGRTVLTAADAAAVRTAIGAGTSSLTIGTSSSTAKAGDYQPTAANISDSTATGRSLLTAADATAAKATLSLTKADVGLSNVDNTSDATKNAASVTLTNKTISGSSNTLTNINISSLSTTGTASSTTYLRGDGSWTAVSGVTTDTPRVIVYSSGWATRPDARPVIWLGGTTATPPSGQATGDLWIDDDALNVTLSSLGVTSTAAELNVLHGTSLTSTAMGYLANVTSDVQAQLNAKRAVAPRVSSITSSATPSVNVDNYDAVSITALATSITSVTVSGTPNNFQSLLFRIKDDGTTRAITWGASFEAGSVALPNTTTAGKTMLVGFKYDSVDALWACEAVGTRS